MEEPVDVQPDTRLGYHWEVIPEMETLLSSMVIVSHLLFYIL